MGKFQDIAGRLAEILQGIEEGIKAEDISEIIGGGSYQGEPINCYPGIPGHGCYPLAVFVSIKNKKYTARKPGHLNCNEAMEKIVQHMQGQCKEITKNAVLITDNWDPDAWENWGENLKRISNEAHLEIYLIVGCKVSEIYI